MLRFGIGNLPTTMLLSHAIRQQVLGRLNQMVQDWIRQISLEKVSTLDSRA